MPNGGFLYFKSLSLILCFSLLANETASAASYQRLYKQQALMLDVIFMMQSTLKIKPVAPRIRRAAKRERKRPLKLAYGSMLFWMPVGSHPMRLREALMGVILFSAYLGMTYAPHSWRDSIRTFEIYLRKFFVALFAAVLKVADSETSKHSERLAQMLVYISRKLGYSPAETENMQDAGRLHDIGNIATPDYILHKPGKLTDEEYFEMKRHLNNGIGMLWLFIPKDVLKIIKEHHENWNGLGYPNQTKGNAISPYARVFKIADVYDALRHDRRYRKADPMNVAFAMIRENAGTEFDPNLVERILDIIKQWEEEKNPTQLPRKPQKLSTDTVGLRPPSVLPPTPLHRKIISNLHLATAA